MAGNAMTNSCVGCKFLYLQDYGYSNYTVTDTWAHCAKSKNPNLEKPEPCDWNQSHENDNWPATNNSRCEEYAQFSRKELNEWPIHLAVEDSCANDINTDDEEAIAAIVNDLGWK